MSLFDDDLIEKDERSFINDMIYDFVIKNYTIGFTEFSRRDLKNYIKRAKEVNGVLVVNGPKLCLYPRREATSITGGLFKWGKVKEFIITNNDNITDLTGAPTECQTFSLRGATAIKTLKGSPEIIYGDCYVSKCDNLVALDSDIRMVTGNFLLNNCPKVKDLTGMPAVVGKNIQISYSNIESLKGITKSDRREIDWYGVFNGDNEKMAKEAAKYLKDFRKYYFKPSL